jgi:hypothetical protein
MTNNCTSCNINKNGGKKDNTDKKDKKVIEKERNIEHFSFEGTRNMCHYGCSSINFTNIILVVLVLVLLYLLSKEKLF